MAQGNHKLARSKKSAGAQKKRGAKAVKIKRKGSSAIVDSKAQIATTKAINRKNERIVAAKALNGGTAFYLKDIAERGKSEAKRQTAIRDKKQNKPTDLKGRLQFCIETDRDSPAFNNGEKRKSYAQGVALKCSPVKAIAMLTLQWYYWRRKTR
eukprot:scaffold346_cov116-Cylindrotheca_fusiformis.AAC.36